MLGAPTPEDNYQSAPLGHTEMVGAIRQSRTAPWSSDLEGDTLAWPRAGRLVVVRFRASQVAEATGGQLVGQDGLIDGATQDSRLVTAGCPVSYTHLTLPTLLLV